MKILILGIFLVISSCGKGAMDSVGNSSQAAGEKIITLEPSSQEKQQACLKKCTTEKATCFNSNRFSNDEPAYASYNQNCSKLETSCIDHCNYCSRDGFLTVDGNKILESNETCTFSTKYQKQSCDYTYTEVNKICSKGDWN